MIEMIFGVYGVIWWLISKQVKILPIHLWTVVTSIFIAAVTIIFLFIWLGRYQPVTKYARTYAITTSVISEVQGRVIEVTRDGGKPLKTGDMLFKIDPETYESRLDSIAAQLKLAELRLKQESDLVASGAGNQYDLDTATSEADRLKADLRGTQYQLAATTVRAPADGYVTQVAIRPGQFVVPIAFSQVMVLVHAEAPILVAGFPQAGIEFINAGDEAEIAFDAAPGRLFKGKVKAVRPLMAEGAASASGMLVAGDESGKRGRTPISIEITDEDYAKYNLPAGSSATEAVLTGKMHHFNILRRMILRIKSWDTWVVVA